MTGQFSKTVILFISGPGDVVDEKQKLAEVVEGMVPSFMRHGIALQTWAYEKHSVPSVTPPGGSAQTIVDKQMPRNPDGSIAYDLFVGLMDRRIGTALKDAPSGTAHEFFEAKSSFEASGKPHILFYFRAREAQVSQSDPQMDGVLKFRAQYPGLFATYTSIPDLETQFRGHLLTELLDLLQPDASRDADPGASEWWDRISARYTAIRADYPATFLDYSPTRLRRILRQLHLLFSIERLLYPHERRVLTAALLSHLLNESDREQFEAFAGETPEITAEIRDVVGRSLCDSKLAVRSHGPVRLDLLGALATIALRLDLTRHAIAPGVGEPDINGRNIDEWLGFLTEEIVCERGIVRFHLLAPSGAWVDPLIGATAVALEALWQSTRTVLTRYGMSFAVARSRVETDADVGPVPPAVLESIARRAQETTESLPAFPHFGESTNLPDLGTLLPLPFSKVRAPVTFRAPRPGPVRLLADGAIVAQEPESGVIEYLPPPGAAIDCVLECDEAGAFLPVVQSRLQRLSPVEGAILSCSLDRAGALRSLGLWNDLLETIWPGASRAEPDREDLSAAFHILRNAFEEMRLAVESLLERRDVYWDAMETIRKRLTNQEG